MRFTSGTHDSHFLWLSPSLGVDIHENQRYRHFRSFRFCTMRPSLPIAREQGQFSHTCLPSRGSELSHVKGVEPLQVG